MFFSCLSPRCSSLLRRVRDPRRSDYSVLDVAEKTQNQNSKKQTPAINNIRPALSLSQPALRAIPHLRR